MLTFGHSEALRLPLLVGLLLLVQPACADEFVGRVVKFAARRGLWADKQPIPPCE
jgi:hypothetical protein